MILDYIIILLKSMISIPLIFFIPGFLINSIYVPNKSLKFNSSLILHIFVSIIITSFTGLILAQLGIFSLFNLVALLVLVSIILYQKYKKLPEKPDFNPIIEFNRNNVLVTLLIISSVLLFFHPFPWIAGGRDPGVYVSTGVHIAKTGSILIKDPLIAQMNTSIQEILYDVEPASVYGFISWANMNSKFQFPGFYITDLGTGTITPQFLHIYPVWIAIFYSIFGLPGAFFVNPVFGVLSILSLYMIGKKLFSWKVGALAGFLLVFNFAQIWYARYPFSEIMGQFFILSGLVTFIEFNRTSDRCLAVISALLFGLILLTKTDAFFLLVPLAIYFIYLIINKQINISHKYYLVGLFSMFVYILIDYILFTRPYVSQTIQIAIIPPPVKLEAYNYNLFSILNTASWYTTQLGLFLAFIGLGIFILKKNNKEKLLMVFIALMFIFMFLSKLPIGPDPPPWWARRLVPVIIPSYALFSSYAIKEIAEINKIGIYISRILIILLIMFLVITSLPIIDHSEGSGMIEGVSEFSKYFNDNDIIIMGPSSESAEISTPLYYIYNKKAIFLSRFNPFPTLGYHELPPPEKISLGLDYLISQGYDVYAAFSPQDSYTEKVLFSLSTKYDVDFINTNEFSYKHLEITRDHLNLIKKDIPMKLVIYKISLTKSDVFNYANFSIDIGSHSDISYVENGFYPKETWGGFDNRWTSGNASLRIPTQIKNNLSISIIAGGFRPRSIPPANVSLYFNEHFIGNFVTEGEYEMHNMTVNKDYVTYPYSTLRIISSTWNPSEYLGSPDNRDLGINVDKVSIEKS